MHASGLKLKLATYSLDGVDAASVRRISPNPAAENLGTLLANWAGMMEAEPLYRRPWRSQGHDWGGASGLFEPQQSRAPATGHGQVCGGRAALPRGHRDRQGHDWGGASGICHQPQQSRAPAAGHGQVCGGRAALPRGAFKIGKATIGEEHPEYASTSTISRSCCRTWAGMRRPSRFSARPLQIGKATIGEAHPEYAIRLQQSTLPAAGHGQVRRRRGRNLLKKAVAIWPFKALGDDHPNTQSAVAANLRKSCSAKHFPDDPALAELEATFGPDIGK